MAIKAPPPPKSSKKGEPPRVTETRGNLEKPEPTKIVPLNFRVSAEFKKDFKIASAVLGITQSELLQRIFEDWKERNG